MFQFEYKIQAIIVYLQYNKIVRFIGFIQKRIKENKNTRRDNSRKKLNS